MSLSDPRLISIHDYTYDLAEDRIALFPLEDRTSASLLIYKTGKIQSDIFRNLSEYLPENTLMVMNETRVVNARLVFSNSSGSRIECFCLEPASGTSIQDALHGQGPVQWLCMVGNRKRWKEESLCLELSVGDQMLRLFATRIRSEGRDEVVEFSWDQADLTFSDILDRLGELPLPPYLYRKAEDGDTRRYNTVYASKEGSVAAPTAGLHFNSAMLEEIQESGIALSTVTLHVGAGTFRQVSTATMGGHDMHGERIFVSLDNIRLWIESSGQKKILAIGTTSLRTLESVYWFGVRCCRNKILQDGLLVEQWDPYDLPKEEAHLPDTASALKAVEDYLLQNNLSELEGVTRLLIAPGYRFRMVDILLTNFHQPGSTLLLLVAAFAGEDWRTIYQFALDQQFRFLSFGDSSLLFRNVNTD